jgi:hypothetical protein
MMGSVNGGESQEAKLRFSYLIAAFGGRLQAVSVNPCRFDSRPRRALSLLSFIYKEFLCGLR